jgi:hypothetical protein
MAMKFRDDGLDMGLLFVCGTVHDINNSARLSVFYEFRTAALRPSILTQMSLLTFRLRSDSCYV